jgi:hypothetical protein
LKDVLEPEFQQGFDFFGFFGDFYGKFVVGPSFKECVFDVYASLCGHKLLVRALGLRKSPIRFMSRESAHVK